MHLYYPSLPHKTRHISSAFVLSKPATQDKASIQCICIIQVWYTRQGIHPVHLYYTSLPHKTRLLSSAFCIIQACHTRQGIYPEHLNYPSLPLSSAFCIIQACHTRQGFYPVRFVLSKSAKSSLSAARMPLCWLTIKPLASLCPKYTSPERVRLWLLRWLMVSFYIYCMAGNIF